MNYFGRRYFETVDSLCHAYYDKTGQQSSVDKNTTTQGSGKKRDLGGTSISNEKGTDNKKNNTSEYNHDYYVHHKDKWDVKTEDNLDIGDGVFTEENRIGNGFYAMKNSDGRWVIVRDDMKWVLPEGEELTSALKNKLKNITGDGDDWEKQVLSVLNDASDDFDIDAAAMDIIRGKYKNGAERRAALGDDYQMIQDRVNEILLGKKTAPSGGTSSSSESSASSDNSESGGKRLSNTWYNKSDNKIIDDAETAKQKQAAKEAEEERKRLEAEAEAEKARKKAEKEAKKNK